LKLFGKFYVDKKENKTAVRIGPFRLFTYALFMTLQARMNGTSRQC
jgi:hypothetical protein